MDDSVNFKKIQKNKNEKKQSREGVRFEYLNMNDDLIIHAKHQKERVRHQKDSVRRHSPLYFPAITLYSSIDIVPSL